jgi:hypothetical protein
MQGMIHCVNCVACPLLAQFPLLDPPTPLVESLRDNFKVGVSEKEAHYRTMHLTFLLLILFSEVLRNIFFCVALGTQEILKCLYVTAHFIPFQDHFTLGLYIKLDINMNTYVDRLCDPESI